MLLNFLLYILASSKLYKSCEEGFADVSIYEDFTGCYNAFFFVNFICSGKGNIDFISSCNSASVLSSKWITTIVFHSSTIYRVSKVILGLLLIFTCSSLIAIAFFLIIKVHNNTKAILLYWYINLLGYIK